MHSRKRHLVAFLIATLFSGALTALAWINLTGERITPSNTQKVVPVALSELVSAPKTTPHAAKPNTSPTPHKTTPRQPKAQTAPIPSPKKPQTPPKPRPKPPTPKHQPTSPPKPKPPAQKPEPTPSAHPQPAPKPLKPQARPAPTPHTPAAQTISKPPVPIPKHQPVAATSATNSVSPPKPLAVDPGLKRRYLDALRRTIAQLAQDSYPYRARRRGLEGTVVLSFVINQDGRINHLRLHQSSGYTLLDEAARQVIEEEMRMRFRPFPQGLNLSQIEVSIPIRYQLR